MPKTLADLSPGESGRILSITGDDSISARLLEMGLTPGQPIVHVRTALLGDPLEVEVRGYRLSLRRLDASRVLLEAAPSSVSSP